MPAKDYIPSKEGDIVPWTENFIAVANTNLANIKTTYEAPLPEPVGHNFFRCKNQRGDLVSDNSNVAAV